jgi:hypothetical protein
MRHTASFSCLILAACVACAACAGSGRSPTQAAVEPPRDIDVGNSQEAFTLTVRREANVSSATLAASEARLWPMLVLVFNELGLTVTTSDPASRLLRSSTGKRVTVIDRQRVARFFECPATGYGNSAQGQDTYLMAQAQLLKAAENSTQLRMQTEAHVVLNGNRVLCRSNGRLEQRISEALSSKAGLLP